jgi:hypothetical protein
MRDKTAYQRIKEEKKRCSAVTIPFECTLYRTGHGNYQVTSWGFTDFHDEILYNLDFIGKRQNASCTTFKTNNFLMITIAKTGLERHKDSSK